MLIPYTCSKFMVLIIETLLMTLAYRDPWSDYEAHNSEGLWINSEDRRFFAAHPMCGTRGFVHSASIGKPAHTSHLRKPIWNKQRAQLYVQFLLSRVLSHSARATMFKMFSQLYTKCWWPYLANPYRHCLLLYFSCAISKHSHSLSSELSCTKHLYTCC